MGENKIGTAQFGFLHGDVPQDVLRQRGIAPYPVNSEIIYQAHYLDAPVKTDTDIYQEVFAAEI